ncbi:AH receptor-interacting protein-like [Diadema antillarum]|uniref:AH receptor-interacting protein-like n=1 Tax=Diadema antillarum TaxID=105358 RepID=UPI003A872910
METGLGTGLGYGIKKSIVHPGKGSLPLYPDGTKVTFHYKCSKCDEDGTVIEDTKKVNKPMEILTGKSFKFEVWENALKTMRHDEVAEFLVDPEHLTSYPPVEAKLRDFRHGKKITEERHCCGMAQVNKSGLGYEDLDALMNKLEPLKFTMEIVSIEEPGQHRLEAWAMNDEQKRAVLPQLREEGNRLYKEGDYVRAAEKYAEALGCLENLLLHEKPNSAEWLELDGEKIPFLLNFAQCKLYLKEYYQVIEHTTTVLEKDEDNVKALYRRAKAHAACWNFFEARKDFTKAAKLDTKLGASIRKELAIIDETEKQKDREDKTKLKNLFSE